MHCKLSTVCCTIYLLQVSGANELPAKAVGCDKGGNTMIKQISVFLANKHSRLARVMDLMRQNDIVTRAVVIADTIDFGILRLVVDQPTLAANVLKEDGFVVSETDVLAVAVPDEPGGLAGMLDILTAASINVEYLYTYIDKSGGEAIVVLRVDDIIRGRSTLLEAGKKLLTEKEVYND